MRHSVIMLTGEVPTRRAFSIQGQTAILNRQGREARKEKTFKAFACFAVQGSLIYPGLDFEKALSYS